MIDRTVSPEPWPNRTPLSTRSNHREIRPAPRGKACYRFRQYICTRQNGQFKSPVCGRNKVAMGQAVKRRFGNFRRGHSKCRARAFESALIAAAKVHFGMAIVFDVPSDCCSFVESELLSRNRPQRTSHRLVRADHLAFRWPTTDTEPIDIAPCLTDSGSTRFISRRDLVGGLQGVDKRKDCLLYTSPSPRD